MEQLTGFLLGVLFTIYTSYKIPRPHGTINHISFIVYTSYKILRPHGTINHFSIGVSFRVNMIQKSEKREKADMHEVPRGFTFPTDFSENLTRNIVTQKCTKVIKHCACAVKLASLRRDSFRSGNTLSPARNYTMITMIIL